MSKASLAVDNARKKPVTAINHVLVLLASYAFAFGVCAFVLDGQSKHDINFKRNQMEISSVHVLELKYNLSKNPFGNI